MGASVKAAIAAPGGNGDSAAVIERNPDYDSWEAERIALVLRIQELAAIAEGVNEDTAAASAYLAAESDGFQSAYCQEQADKVRSRYRDIRAEQTRINARLSIIKPFVSRERMEVNRAAEKDDFKPRLMAYLERIATSIEGIESKLTKAS